MFLGLAVASAANPLPARGAPHERQAVLSDDALSKLDRFQKAEKRSSDLQFTSKDRIDSSVLFDRGRSYENRSGVTDCVGDTCLAKAIDHYKRAVEQGSARAAIRLGHIFGKATGVPQDLVEASRWYGRAAELGDANGLVNQAKLLVEKRYNPTRSPKHFRNAARLLERAESSGSAWATNYLGWLYESEPVHFDCPAGSCLTRAIDHYTRAAAGGYAKAAENLGRLYRDGTKLPMDLAEANKWFQRTAELGNDNGLVHQAHLLVGKRFNPNPSENDYRKALQLLEAAERKDNAWALNYLGHLYETKTGIDHCEGNICLDKAMQFYRRAIAGNFALAAIKLGLIYRSGRGLPEGGVQAPDLSGNGSEPTFGGEFALLARMLAAPLSEPVRPRRQYEPPTSQFQVLQRAGKRWALFYLGRMYESETGSDDCFADECRKRAAVYYERAANLGHADAAVALGRFHLAGDRMTRNRVEARKWFQKAGKLGSADGLLFQAALLIDKRYNTGQTPREYDYARKLLAEAANKGNARAMNYLGWMYETRTGITDCNGETCNARAVEFYRKAFDNGYQRAAESLRSNRRRQNGVPQDLTEAGLLFARAADLGNSNGLVHQANLLANSHYNARPTEEEYQQALSFLDDARRRDNVWATHYLGWMYEHKKGVGACRRDACLAKAIELYKQAAGNGFSQAAENLGTIYRTFYRRGKGDWWHYGEAYEWFEKAANLGDSDGLVQMAVLIADPRYGSRRTPDECRRAASLLERAERNGSSWAPKEYGRLFVAYRCRTKEFQNRRHRKGSASGILDGLQYHR